MVYLSSNLPVKDVSKIEEATVIKQTMQEMINVTKMNNSTFSD